MTRTIVALALAGFALAGCGTTTGDRGLSGAGIGAATGAVIGAAVGAPLVGAAIGAGSGASIGALTSRSAVDLGKPVWEQKAEAADRTAERRRGPVLPRLTDGATWRAGRDRRTPRPTA